jgi:hypothetical protein
MLRAEAIVILAGTIKSERTKNVDTPDNKGPAKRIRFVIENNPFVINK